MKTYSIRTLFKTSWEELSCQEFISVIALSDAMHGIVDKSSEKYGLYVIAMLKAIRKNKSLVSKLNIEQAVDCFNDITFFKRNEKGEFLTPWYFFPVETFWAGRSKFVKPEMNGELPIYYRSLDQLIYADGAFSSFCVMSYQADPKFASDMDDALNSMIAVLYQSPEDFNITKAEAMAAQIKKKLSPNKKALLLHTYANVRKFITDRYPNLFPRREDDGKEVIPQQTGPMWLNLRFDLAETEVFKGFDTARNSLFYDALDYLEKKLKEAPKQKAHA
jgi:hypothetical protein